MNNGSPPPSRPEPPAFGPEHVMQTMNAAVHLCQQSGAFVANGFYCAILAIPHANPEHAEVVATGHPSDLATALEAVAAKVRKKFGAPGIIIPTPGQASNLNGLRIRHEE